LSALTKIAVVLLVVASLLLSAGVVVFVNKVEDFRKTQLAAVDRYNQEVASNKNNRVQVEALNAQLLSTSKDLNSRLDTLKQESAGKDATVLELKNQISKLDQDKKGVEVALGNLTKVQEGLQGQLAAAQTQVTDLRKIRDQLVDERHSLNVQLTDALSKVDALGRAYKNAEERLQGKTAEMDDLTGKVKSAGLNINSLPKRGNEGAPQLEAVVSSVFNAGGKPWASVTIGSKDMVEKGMKFNVVNNKEFLGYLTIQTTEPTEAAGVLEGPKVEKVKTGDQVKTQLQ
jgi:predicted  nucleic acid-binding Zn-ribbon protein